MNRWILLLLLLVVAIITLTFWFPSPNQINDSASVEMRAAIDIGSGATNLKVAKVDRDTNKIIAQIFEQSIAVPYQKHLEQSENSQFDPIVMQQGMEALQNLKKVADSYHVKKIVAVATAAFRKASNVNEFVKQIQQQTGIEVRIIDQDEEGILAFRAALALSPIQAEQAVVWDIGGGSMQLTTLTENGLYLVEKGKTASIPFKNAIIEQIKGANLQEMHSPNPLDPTQMQQALHLARNLASTTNPYIQAKIAHPQTHVLAVGSLFNFGIRPLVHNQTLVMQSELEQATNALTNKTDAELPGKSALAEVGVSNPLLVLGYMQGLHINRVEILNVNNADGALTYPAYWE
jgi:exopolyphosphatase/guanosine-5'-triphosphate,3'-diphosphate pyrophosphatase